MKVCTTLTDALKTALAQVRAKSKAAGSPDIATDDMVAKMAAKMFSVNGYIAEAQSMGPIAAFINGYGISLDGPTGIGKTMLTEALGCKAYKCVDIVKCKSSGLPAWLAATDNHMICLDDLGLENVNNEYGNKEDLLKVVIGHRCELMARTCITTNLKPEEVALRYSDRIASRIIGMCKSFKMTGRNRRRPVSSRSVGATAHYTQDTLSCTEMFAFAERLAGAKRTGARADTLDRIRLEAIAEFSELGWEAIKNMVY